MAACAAALIDRVTPSKKHLKPEEYFGSKDGQTAIIGNGVLLEEKALTEDGLLYLPYEYVHTELAPSIFYDREEEKLILTGPASKEILELTDGRTNGGEALSREDGLYISSGLLEQYASLKLTEFEEPQRLCIWSQSSLVMDKTEKKSVIRKNAGIKSPIVKDLEESEILILQDVNADGSTKEGKAEGWTRVATEDGFSGYIKDGDLAGSIYEEDVSLSPGQGEYTRCRIDGKLNMVFHQTTDQASNDALTEAVGGMSGVNAIAPTWFFLDDTDGAVHSLASPSYVETAHAMGLKVYAVLNDFDGGLHSAAETAEALGNDTKRSAIVASVMEGLRDSGADGLNIDIELVKEETADSYLELLREFSAELRKEGKSLLIDTFVPKFTMYLNRTEQARVADYVVLMCYDEHSASSAEAGSVSSASFLEEGVRKALEEVPADQLVAALPFYTRLWETAENGEVSSQAYGMSSAAQAVSSLEMTPEWDEKCGQNYGEKQSGDTLYQIWLEDGDSLARKMEILRQYDIAGIAEWKLGFETEDIWEVLKEGLS